MEDIEVKIYKNLFDYLRDKECPEFIRVFTFLIRHKKNILLLLTNGNLDTKFNSTRVLK